MVKAYLRYTLSQTCGLISTHMACFATTGNNVIAAGHEALLVWNINQGTLVRTMKDGRERSTRICINPAGNTVAAG